MPCSLLLSIIFEKHKDAPLVLDVHESKFGFFKSEIPSGYEIDFFVALGKEGMDITC